MLTWPTDRPLDWGIHWIILREIDIFCKNNVDVCKLFSYSHHINNANGRSKMLVREKYESLGDRSPDVKWSLQRLMELGLGDCELKSYSGKAYATHPNSVAAKSRATLRAQGYRILGEIAGPYAGPNKSDGHIVYLAVALPGELCGVERVLETAKRAPCNCSAYPFPHSTGGGKCKEKFPMAK